MRKFPLTFLQTLFIIGAFAALFFVIRFSQNGAVYRDMLGSEATFEAVVAAEATRSVELQATLTYVESDTYVEDYFRNEAGMVKPGERRVVPRVVIETPEPLAAPAPTPDIAVYAHPWQMWWRLLTDAPQPSAEMPPAAR
jgi:hypothetical protein